MLKNPPIIKPIICHIAIPRPVWQLFNYYLDQKASAQPIPLGARVQVPFGKQQVIGIVIKTCAAAEQPISELKPIIEILDQKPILDTHLLELITWASRYYVYPLGETCNHALPKWIREGRKTEQFELYWHPQEDYQLNALLAEVPKRAKKQQLLLEMVYQAENGCKEQDLLSAKISQQTITLLQEKGWIKKQSRTMQPTEHSPPKQPIIKPELNLEQLKAVEEISEKLNCFQVSLLDGVTGSGKTEVYMQLIAKTLQQDKQALVLIPEINLTPQLLARFSQRFVEPIAVLHSGLTDKQRYQNWLLAYNGRAQIVIGTRSAVFVPLPNPGLLIIDEEHDGSYKQQEGFRYSARDLLIKRGQLAQCPVVLGSATPSIESFYNVQIGKYQHCRLSQRAGSSQLPQIEIIDTHHQPLEKGISKPLLHHIQQQVESGNQTLLFINRRGFAPVLMCYSCGWQQNCTHCDARLFVHFEEQVLRCHHCNATKRFISHCPKCESTELNTVGIGTEQVTHFLQAQFPNARIARVDRDTTSRKGELEKVLQRVQANEIDILVGTQMLAKGHHFPNLNLVGVLDIDGAFYSSDFRAPERMGQLLIQVAGRAGREQTQGLVVLQTAFPKHELLQPLLDNHYAEFSQLLLQNRSNTDLPPYSFQALVRIETPISAPTRGIEILNNLKKWTKQYVSELSLLGPIPAPMHKRAGRIHSQLLLQAKQRKQLNQAVYQMQHYLQQRVTPGTWRWSIDVDPQDIY